ncbi:MAG: YegS/Rv2252/BmrU family lipid kinase [Ruminiclostridium sp.]|nr:YegS/Rv2252/BmrU family lipid kinase [Ruminiclostridium sp.]
MKTYFIVNPASGKKNSLAEITEKLKGCELPYEIYSTKGKGDATEFVKKICSSNPDEPIRFCACGGDGTLNEVVNGAVHSDNAEVACYPCGSGNDYVKYYGGKDRFMDIKSLMTAPAKAIDLIKVGDRYSINVVNFGFDTEVCVTMEKVKSKPVIGGGNAYTTGVVKALLTAMKTKGNVYADGELLNEKNRFLLCTVANGKYIGGRFCCAPRSLNDDGLLEVCLAKKISRLTFIKLVGVYEKGKHLDDKRFSDILQYRRCKKVEIKAEKGFAITLDGEVIPGEEFICEIAPKKLKFAVPPLKSEIKNNEKEMALV